MGKQPEPLAAFLKRAKSTFQSALSDRSSDGQITLVTGNQSADLDSMSSAILYAYLSSTDSASTSSSSGLPLIPVISIPAEDLSIRPEFEVAFRLAGIDAKDLVTLSDFPPPADAPSKLPPQRTRWILVDHNKLEGELVSKYSDQVIGVIDHHVDENAVPADAAVRTIRETGSCTSLVVDHFKTSPVWGRAPTSGESLTAHQRSQVARLALGSILVDTNKLRNTSKTTETDRTAAKLCLSVIRAEPGNEGFKKKHLFEELFAAKSDIGHLPLDGILRKDYKAWTEAGLVLGMSSVVKPLTFLRDKATTEHQSPQGESGWDKAQREFMEARGLDLHGILAPNVSERDSLDKGGKGLLVRWRTEPAKAAIGAFEKSNKANLQLRDVSIQGMLGEGEHGTIWEQGDRSKTRKQVGPLLRQAMKGE